MKRILIGISFFLAMAASVFAQSSDLTPLAVIKLDKQETITLKQLRSRVEFLKIETGVEKLTVEQKKQVLDSLISEKLVVQAAAKEGITISDSDVNAAFLSTFSQQLGQQVTEAQLNDFIQRQTGKTLAEYIKDRTNMTLAEYKEYLRNQLIAQRYVFAKSQDALWQVAATDAEIRQAYEMNRAQFVWSDMMKLFLVVVPKGSDAPAAKTAAEGLLAQYKSGGPGTELKIRSSTDNGKKYQADYLIIQKSSEMAQRLGWTYDKLIELFGRNKGYVGELSVTDRDYQFYVVIDKYAAKMLELSDIVEPDSTVTVYDFIKQRLTAQKQSQFLSTSAQELAKGLDTKANVDRRKTGSSLDKVLENW